MANDITILVNNEGGKGKNLSLEYWLTLIVLLLSLITGFIVLAKYGNRIRKRWCKTKRQNNASNSLESNPKKRKDAKPKDVSGICDCRHKQQKHLIGTKQTINLIFCNVDVSHLCT